LSEQFYKNLPKDRFIKSDDFKKVKDNFVKNPHFVSGEQTFWFLVPKSLADRCTG
jgi:hypothetical protein